MKVYDVLCPLKGDQSDTTKWVTVGVLIEKDDGKKSIKLDVVPISPDWTGWLIVKERDQEPQKTETDVEPF